MKRAWLVSTFVDLGGGRGAQGASLIWAESRAEANKIVTDAAAEENPGRHTMILLGEIDKETMRQWRDKLLALTYAGEI
jgi:hypothetical protein